MASRMPSDSPSSIGTSTVYQLPEKAVGTSVILRLDTDSAGRCHIAIGYEPSDTKADFFLDEGESIELDWNKVKKASEVFVKGVSGTPILYWGVK